MKIFRKVTLVLLVGFACICLTGCGSTNIEGSLEEIMEKVYLNISEDNLPMMLTNIEVTEENVEGYLGTEDIDFVDALASESAVGSIAHSVVLIRTEENADVEKIKETIKDSVNPRKWICVEAENVYVESKGDLIIVIMCNELADDIKTNFENLK